MFAQPYHHTALRQARFLQKPTTHWGDTDVGRALPALPRSPLSPGHCTAAGTKMCSLAVTFSRAPSLQSASHPSCKDPVVHLPGRAPTRSGTWGIARPGSHCSALVIGTLYYTLLNQVFKHITCKHLTFTNLLIIGAPYFPFSWCQVAWISFTQIMLFQKTSTKSTIPLFCWNFSSKDN